MGSMEASLQDMTRASDRFGPLMGHYDFDPDELELELELELEIELITDDTFADPWFTAHDDTIAVADDELPIDAGRGLHGIVCFGLAVTVAALLVGATF